MTHDHEVHEVVERSSGAGAVAVVAIVILVVLAILAVMAFGGLNWLRGSRVEYNNNTTILPGNDNSPGVMPTLPAYTQPAPAGYYLPAGSVG